MVDVGCGSGQSTFSLSPLCERVVGTDISPAQINNALKLLDKKNSSNVEFKVASSHQLPFSDESVSMVTCGEAWHWFDPVTVHHELRRILKSSGCLAVYGYLHPSLNDKECNALYQDFFSVTLKDYWHDNVKIIRAHAHNDPTVTFPFPIKERHDIEVHSSISVEMLCGFIESLGTYQSYKKANPDSTALKDLADQLKEISSSDTLDVVSSYYLYICSDL